MRWPLILIVPLLVGPLVAEDVRPDGTTAEDGTDCTTSNAHTRMGNDPADTPWTEADDCEATSCISNQDFNFVSNLTMASPSANPTTGTDDQAIQIRARVCDPGQGGTARVDIDVYCSTTLVHDGSLQPLTWSAGNGAQVTETWTFNTTDCAADGSDVEIFIECDCAGGSPSNRVCCDFQAVEWQASVAAAAERLMVIAASGGHKRGEGGARRLRSE